MRHQKGFNVALGCVALASALVVGGCADGIFPSSDEPHHARKGEHSGGHYGGSYSGGHEEDPDGGVAGCEDDGSGGTAGSGGSAGSAGSGGSAGSAGSGGSGGSDGESRADAAPAYASLFGDTAATLGLSSAWYPDNEGPNFASVPGDTDVQLIGLSLDLGDFLLTTSRTEATSAIDCNARSGLLGEDLSFESDIDPSQPFSLDLAALGGNIVPTQLLNMLHLEVGALAAETSFVDGVLSNRYRVADVDLVIGSPLVGAASQQLYQAIGAIETQIEALVAATLGGALLDNISIPLLPVPTITVDSDLQQAVFANILTQQLTSANQALTIDLSTGTIAVHLDELVQGGLNNQPPNTEIINAGTYALLTEPVGEILQDAMTTALGSVEGALGAVTITVRWAGPVGILGDQLDVSWSFTLEQALNGNLPAPTNNSSGLVAQTMATTLITAINVLRVVDSPIGAVLKPVYDQIINNAGNQLFELVVGDIVGDVGGSIMNLLQPVFGVASQIVSVQVNHQTTETCTSGMGEIPEKNTISALSIGVLQAVDAARLDLGWASCEVTQPQCD